MAPNFWTVLYIQYRNLDFSILFISITFYWPVKHNFICDISKFLLWEHWIGYFFKLI